MRASAQSTRTWWWMWGAVGWTLFVWVGRIRNVIADASMDTAERARLIALAGSFVLGAVIVASWSVANTEPGTPRGLGRLVRLIAAWTSLYWFVRVLDIALSGDHPAGFVIVHAALAMLSIATWIVASVTAAEGDSQEFVGRKEVFSDSA